jgi:Uma2 family endonuclease
VPAIEEVAEVPVVSRPDLYEVIDGEIVESPPMSAYSNLVANRLGFELALYARDRNNGQAVTEMLFRLPLPEESERERRPDVAFVSHARWPADRPVPFFAGAWDVVPEFACEVVSPNDSGDNVIDKALEYLRAGIKLVWVVYPKPRHIYAYTSKSPRVFGPGETADAGDVLSGFRVALDGLFPTPTRAG